MKTYATLYFSLKLFRALEWCARFYLLSWYCWVETEFAGSSFSFFNWRNHPKSSGCGLTLCCEKWILFSPFFFFFFGLGLPFIYLNACPAGSLLFSVCFCSVPSVCPLDPNVVHWSKPLSRAHLVSNTVESQILTLFGLGGITVVWLLGTVDRKVVYESWLQGGCVCPLEGVCPLCAMALA